VFFACGIAQPQTLRNFNVAINFAPRKNHYLHGINPAPVYAGSRMGKDTRRKEPKAMADAIANVEGTAPLAPFDLAAVLRDADVLLDLMGRESLDVVAELANSLTDSARYAGAVEVAQAANAVLRVVSAKPVTLVSAMHNLTAAIERAQHGRLLAPVA
jgi:hypothetical protein